MFDYRR